MRVYCPAGKGQLIGAIDDALKADGPTAIRYPARMPKWDGGTDSLLQDAEHWIAIQEGTDCVLLCAGVILEEGLKAADLLKQRGISCRVVSCCRVKELNEV